MVKKLYAILIGMLVLIPLFYMNCAGTASPATSAVNAAATTVNSGTTLTISPATISIVASGTTTFTASGGRGNYVYSVMPGGSATGSINSSTGYYTASSASGSDTVKVMDSAGDIAYASITVSSTSTTNPVSTYQICSNNIACGAVVGLPSGKEIAATDANPVASVQTQTETNVLGACTKLGYTSWATYQYSTHPGINNGYCQYYQIYNWNGSSFQLENWPCSYGSVQVVYSITCEK